MKELDSLRVAVLAGDGVEESELTEPVKTLHGAGAVAEVISPKAGEIQAFRHLDKSSRIRVDHALDEVKPEAYGALVLPGGTFNADRLRMVPEVRAFIRHMAAAGKPIAAICHAPWELISAGVVRDRTLTGYATIEDDVRNAGGRWMDREVVLDGNLVTSRSPDDLPAFNREMVRLFARLAQPANRKAAG